MRFWKKEYNYKIIDNTISEKELQELLRKNNIFLDIVDNSTAWAAFAHIYGLKHGFNPIHTLFNFLFILFNSSISLFASIIALHSVILNQSSFLLQVP